MKTAIKILMLLIISFSLSVFAQDKEDYSNEPGYVNFGNLTSFMKSDNVTEVNVEGYLMKMISNLTEKSDPELSNMLRGLKLIKVYSFDANAKNSDQLMSKIDKIDNLLTSKDWDRIVKVRSDKENTNVYIKTTPDQKTIVGLVVTSLQKDGESAFVNIVGDIDMDALGRLGSKFDIPSLENIHK